MVSHASNKLCDPCNSILDKIRHVDWHTDLIHHHSLSTLEESAETGCGVCVVLLEHLQGSAFRKVPDLWDKLFPIKCESDTSSASWQTSFELKLTSGGVEDLSLTFTFELINESKDIESGYIPSSTTDSPQSWGLVGQWLKQCTGGHQRCNAPIPAPWAPTRLLDIGTPGNEYIRLVEQDEDLFSNQPYATVSHCWGRTRLITTRMSNIYSHCKKIPYQELPKSFKDAIRIARYFQLRYLWIDSLCIVQDSWEDWAREAALMSNVYRYAYINIAVTGAAEATEGCFWERHPQAVKPTEFSVQWDKCEETESKRYQVVPDHHIWAQKLFNEPLNQRSWVLQERILAPRVLHFSHEQLFWECREFTACETYYRGLPTSLQDNRLINIKTLSLSEESKDDRWPAKYVSTDVNTNATLMGRAWGAFTALFRPIILQEVTLRSTMKSASVYQDWDAVVEMYSLTSLTRQCDKLVAISGLAMAVSIDESNSPGDGYLAGLWQSSLPSHLLWTTATTEMVRNRRQEIKFPRRYPQEYIAPSWSWASIDGKVSLMWCQRNYDPKEYLATLEDAKVWHNGQRFGEVKSGYIKLSGPLASVLWEADEHPSLASPMAATITHIFPSHLGPHLSAPIPPNATTKSEILFDERVEQAPETLMLLPIIGTMKRVAHENETVAGLVLQREAGTESYSRIGFFFTTRPRACKILRNMARQSVHII
ncbi:HET-domain-containing protein [Amniculicola lignicola CBS 123094]|uniref:HET-domain-containing protein n=1 Tax=Amniculicola lignicola CBS 123094 TaxID=1392246 RepID=A0A6A5WDK0_9PLEO|nr:HET-domain-containing protein [Amniculicola lignicola CBS 123094]